MALEVQAIPLALDALVGLAYLQAQTGEVEQALELSICVASHSASTLDAKGRAEQLRAELEAQLTLQQIEVTQASARAKSFDALVMDYRIG